MLALVAVLGALFGVGLAAAVTAVVPQPAGTPGPGLVPRWWPVAGSWRHTWGQVWRRVLARGGAAVACAAITGAITRWPVGAALAGIGAYVLPVVLGSDRQARRVLERTEAVAVWTEMLRDSLSAAAGLEQTILLTAPFAPPAIRDDVDDLAASLRLGRRLSVALDEFGARIQDPTGRLVARALQQASRRQSRQLPELLSELARRARERANVHLRVAPGHAKIRTNARIIVGFTLAMAAGMVAFNREFLRPYDSALGQLVLLIVGAIFAAGFVGLARLARSGLTQATPAPGTAPTDRAAATAGRADTVPVGRAGEPATRGRGPW